MADKQKKRALIAMSGGVDSSVAAALMVENGYDCIGATMKLFHNEDAGISQGHTCCSLSDVEDARSVAYALNIPHYVFNFTDDFSAQVIRRFVTAYEAGETPNPCIDCNRHLKFHRLYDRAAVLDCGAVATGHYARTAYDEKSGRWLLKKARNTAKDQSYALYFLSQKQLAAARFPLGDFADKEEVRAFAAKHHFVNAAKHDSQDICFVPNGDYAAFIKQYTGKTYPHGPFIDETGRILGEHQGIIRYTLGQRRGLGLSCPQPMYVCKILPAQNTVVLSPKQGLYSQRLIAGEFNWIVPAPEKSIRITAKTRYRARETPAKAEQLPDGTVRVIFDTPQRAVTPGQAVVLYDGEIVVGGGVIRTTESV